MNAKNRAYHAAARAYRPTALQTARHEAGHVLAHIATCTPFALVRLGPETGQHGCVYSAAFHQVDGWTRALISFAGPMAEGTYMTAEADVQHVVDANPAWVKDRSPGSPGRTALELVRTHRGDIADIATILVRDRETGPTRLLAELPQLVALLESITR